MPSECVTTDRRMAKFRTQDVIAQGPELALIGIIPAATNKKPPKATRKRKTATLNIQRFSLCPFLLSFRFSVLRNIVEGALNLSKNRTSATTAPAENTASKTRFLNSRIMRAPPAWVVGHAATERSATYRREDRRRRR